MVPKRRLKKISNYDEKWIDSSLSSSMNKISWKKEKAIYILYKSKIILSQTEKKYFSCEVEGLKVINKWINYSQYDDSKEIIDTT